MITPEIYSTITSESVEQLALVLARRDLTAIARLKPIADFEELISFTTENPTPVAHSNRNPVWHLESVSARLIEAVAISVHEPAMRDAGWRVLSQIILKHTEYLYTYHHSRNPRVRLQAGAALALVSSLCPVLSQSTAWRLVGFARIAESIPKIDDVPSYVIEHIDAAFELGRELDLPIFGEAIDRYVTTINRDFSWDKRTHFELSDAEFFNHLNLCHPGFEDVKSEWERGNLQEAKLAHTSVKQSFLNCKNWADLWTLPLSRRDADSLEFGSDQFPYSGAFHQKRPAEMRRPFANKCPKLFFGGQTHAESPAAMSFDMAKSYLECARFYSTYQGLDNTDVHLETSAIGIAALIFPEWRDQEQFLKLALRRYEWLHDEHVLPDGRQCDSMNTAHHFAIISLLNFIQLARRSGIPLPKQFNRRCEMMIEALVYLSLPDASLNPLIQSGSVDMSAIKLYDIAHAAFHREDFLYIGSGGAAGQPPNETSHAFSDTGYYVMRDYWRTDAQHLGFYSGDAESKGQRGEKLNFILHAYGRPLIVHGGGVLAEDCHSTRRYNTVIIDGKRQYRPALHRAARVPNPDNKWLSTSKFDFVEGWHKDGYAQGDPIDCNPLLHHKRSIFYVKGQAQSRCTMPAVGGYFILHDLILGDGVHNLEQIFHLASARCDHIKIYDNRVVCTVECNVSNLVVAPVSGGQHLDVRLRCKQTESLIIPTVTKLTPSELTYIAKRSLPTVMNTVLLPLRPGVERVPELHTNEVLTDPDVLATGFTVKHGRTTDFILISDDGFAGMSTDDVEFVGEYLYLRLCDEGKLQQVMIINGQFLKWRGDVVVDLSEPRTHYESSVCGE